MQFYTVLCGCIQLRDPNPSSVLPVKYRNISVGKGEQQVAAVAKYKHAYVYKSAPLIRPAPVLKAGHPGSCLSCEQQVAAVANNKHAYVCIQGVCARGSYYGGYYVSTVW